MKKYIEPRITVKVFSVKDIVTTSNVTAGSNKVDAENGTQTVTQYIESVAFDQLQFIM